MLPEKVGQMEWNLHPLEQVGQMNWNVRPLQLCLKAITANEAHEIQTTDQNEDQRKHESSSLFDWVI